MPSKKKAIADAADTAALVLEAEIQTTGSHPWNGDLERVEVLRSTAARAGTDPDIVRLRNLLQDAHERIADFENRLEALEVERDAALGERDSAREDVEDLKETVKEAAKDKTAARLDAAAMEKDLAALEREVAGLKAAPTVAAVGPCKECEAHKGVVDSFVKNLAEAVADLTKASKETRALRALLASREAAFEANTARVAELATVEPLAMAGAVLLSATATGGRIGPDGAAIVQHAKALLGLGTCTCALCAAGAAE